MGRRKRPFFRIVAIDSRTRRDGSEIERLGWYDPLKTDVAVDLNEGRIIHWLKKGAQPSETVNNILSSVGMQYKMHLIREGKSEDEIASALTEWQLRQEEIRVRKENKKKAKKKVATAKTQIDEEIAETDDKKLDEVPVEEIETASDAEGSKDKTPAEEASEDKSVEAASEEVKAEEESSHEIKNNTSDDSLKKENN